MQYDPFVAGTHQLIPQVLQRYGLDVESVVVQPLSFVNNATFKVDVAPSTRHSQSFVLRVHRPDETTDDTIHTELRWLLAIRQQTDLRVPRPCQTLGGELVGSAWHPHTPHPFYYVLFEWIDGQFIRTKAQNFASAWQVGQFTAALHQQSQIFSPSVSGSCRSLDSSSLFDWEALHSLRYTEALLTDGQLALFAQVQQKVRDIFDRLGRTSDVFGLIHADLIWKNYFFHDQGVGAVDFESCGWGYYVYDLAPTLLGYRDEPHAGELYAGHIAGYRSLCSFSSEHEQYLPLLIAARHIVSCCWLAKRLTNPDIRRRAVEIIAHRTAAVLNILYG